MKAVILFVEVAFPSIVLGVVTLILVMSMGCHDIEIVQAVEQDETKMMTIEEVNRELQLDICDIQKLESIPYTEPPQFITTLRRH